MIAHPAPAARGVRTAFVGPRARAYASAMLRSPRARLAGVFYLITFVTGAYTLTARGTAGMVAGLVAGACYVVVTVLFYFLFRPVSRSLSLLAALISLAGCAIGPLGQMHFVPRINTLVFFGFYCLLIAYLISRSTFLPRMLSVVMAIAGLGWLTFLSPALAKQLSPYNMIPGLVGEGVLTLWLLVKGVDVQRWKEQAGAGAG